VIYSRRLVGLRKGERLVVEAKMRGGIKRLGYTPLLQSQLVLSNKPGSSSRAGPQKRIGSFAGQFEVQSGFNCTQKASAHSHPCEIRKHGVMRIIRDARATPLKDEGRRIPLYVNLVVGGRGYVRPPAPRRRSDEDPAQGRLHPGPGLRARAQPVGSITRPAAGA
jgi:hypothetical protein